MKLNPFWPASKHSNGVTGEPAPLLAAKGPKYEALQLKESVRANDYLCIPSPGLGAMKGL